MNFFLFRRHKTNAYQQTLALISLVIICGSLVYYLYSLNWTGTVLTLLLSLVAYFLYLKYPGSEHETSADDGEKGQTPAKYAPAAVSYLVILATLIHLLIDARHNRALVSPWETISPWFLPLYGAGLLLLAWLITRTDFSKKWKLLLVSLHYLTSLSLAAIVYIIGYGFDPFVHAATLELIMEQGAVFPKPPYYLGQYSLITVLARLSGLAVETINRWLVPVTAALLLPIAFWRSASNKEQNNADPAARWLVLILLPTLTFSPFIVTTPQNLSYIFLILTVLSGSGKNDRRLTGLLAAATAAIHPLTGLPALAWLSFLAWEKYRHKLNRPLTLISGIFLFLTNSLILPLALKYSGETKFKLRFSELPEKFSWLNGAGQENIFLNTAYFLEKNLALFLVAVSVSALIYSYKKMKNAGSLLAVNFSLLAAYLLSLQLEFGSLINYEQLAYANRIPVIMLIFCLPAIIFSATSFITAIRRGPRHHQIGWLFFFTILSISALYISYPRLDKYHNSRGYSTGAADIKAVREIAADAVSPYIVLANQQVSAAALKELGFNHYHQTADGEIYAYPIPTGGPLYQYYLKMVYEQPDRQTAGQAAALAGVNTGYLVINKYWRQSEQIISAAKINADKWWSIDDEVYVFKYEF